MSSLYETVNNKNIIDIKINELNKSLFNKYDPSILQELFSLIDKKQSILLTISTINEASNMNIGDNSINLNAAVILRKSISSKINLLTNLINDNDINLNKVDIQKQRDKYYKEYLSLNYNITKNDLMINIDN